MQIFKSVLRAIFFTIAVLLLVLNLWQVAAKLLFHQKLPFVAGYAQATVLSGSMEPEFSAGDIVVIRRENAYAVNDVVTYYDGSDFVTHRIIDLDESGRFIPRGDANNTDDAAITAEQIYGKVIKVIPKIGNIVLLIQKPFFLSLLIALIVMIELTGRLIGRMKTHDERN